MRTVESLETQLLGAFPPESFLGVVATHECLECDELRHALQGKSWRDVDDAFLLENDDCLPLLTPEAYRAFLPAWFSSALRDPEGGPATMALINMESSTFHSVFTKTQRNALLACVRYVHESDPFAQQDAVCIARVQAIEANWQS